jgi:hypothetical protein
MSNEITVSGSLTYADAEGTAQTLAMAAIMASVTTRRSTWLKMSVTTAALAIPLGNVTALGWAIFVNRDVTNYLELLTSTGGVAFARIHPGKFAGPFYLGSGITAPFAQANTGACQMEYLICSQ